MKNVFLSFVLMAMTFSTAQAAVSLSCKGEGTSQSARGQGNLWGKNFDVTIARANKNSLYGIIVRMNEPAENYSEVLIASNGYVKADEDYNPRKYEGYNRYSLVDGADFTSVEILVAPGALEAGNPELVMLVHMDQSGGKVNLKCKSKTL